MSASGRGMQWIEDDAAQLADIIERPDEPQLPEQRHLVAGGAHEIESAPPGAPELG